MTVVENVCQVILHVNARLQPMHRFELEDALQMILEKMQLGNVAGGGTCQMQTGEISFCEIEVELSGDMDAIAKLAEIVNRLGVPKGSELQYEGGSCAVGSQEGLALYLNGTDLPEEVYRTCDINYVIEQINQLMSGSGQMYSYWQGPKETALYCYGTSYEEMYSVIKDFCAEYPLCQQCRICQIA